MTSPQLADNVKLLQKAVLMHQGEILLLQRGDQEKSRPGKWDFAGGNSEWPTSTQVISNPHIPDLVREIKEETSVDIDGKTLTHKNLVCVETYFEPDRQLFSIVFGWLIQLPDNFDRNSVVISNEHQNKQWISLDNALSSVDFGGERGEFMRRILQAAQKA